MNTTPTTRITTHAKPITGDHFPACPVCKSKDKVEKASGIYGRGTRIERTSHSRGLTESVKGTALALRLSPPEEPRKPSRSYGFFVFAILFVVLGGVMSLIFAQFLSLSLLNFWQSTLGVISSLLSNQSWPKEISTNMKMYVPVLMFLFLISLLSIARGLIEITNFAELSQLYDEAFDEYVDAFEEWNRLFYCHRCDHEFLR